MSMLFSPYLDLPTRIILTASATLTLTNADAVIRVAGFISGDDLFGMTGGTDGRIMFLVSASRTLATDLIGESLSATASDRFADSHTLDPDSAMGFIYDGAISRWTRFL